MHTANPIHWTYYLNNVFDPNSMFDEFKAVEINTWTIWKIVDVVVSAAVFVFYVYILIAIIIDGIDGIGTYNADTSLVNEPWNFWIFFVLNCIAWSLSATKIVLGVITLEKFSEFDENLLYWWNELKMYIWDPDQRLEFEIETYADIAKNVIITANFFVYW